MDAKFEVGDNVCFNDHGLYIVFGHASALQHMKKLPLKITRVGVEPLTNDGTRDVDVDDPEINKFLLTDRLFDKVEAL